MRTIASWRDLVARQFAGDLAVAQHDDPVGGGFDLVAAGG